MVMNLPTTIPMDRLEEWPIRRIAKEYLRTNLQG